MSKKNTNTGNTRPTKKGTVKSTNTVKSEDTAAPVSEAVDIDMDSRIDSLLSALSEDVDELKNIGSDSDDIDELIKSQIEDAEQSRKKTDEHEEHDDEPTPGLVEETIAEPDKKDDANNSATDAADAAKKGSKPKKKAGKGKPVVGPTGTTGGTGTTPVVATASRHRPKTVSVATVGPAGPTGSTGTTPVVATASRRRPRTVSVATVGPTGQTGSTVSTQVVPTVSVATVGPAGPTSSTGNPPVVPTVSRRRRRTVSVATAAAAGTTGANQAQNNPLLGPGAMPLPRPVVTTGTAATGATGTAQNVQPTPVPLAEILRKAAQDKGVNYTPIIQCITTMEASSVKTLTAKYYEDDCIDDCKLFVTFVEEILNANSYREVVIILSEVLSYLKKNAGVTLSAMNIIMYCNELNKSITDKRTLAISGLGYTKVRAMVENAFIITYLNAANISLNLDVGNDVDPLVGSLVISAVSTAYSLFGYVLGDIADKYVIAYQRLETEKPEMLTVVSEGDYESFYKMLKTFSGYSTVGIDLNDIDLNIDSYSPGEVAALYAAVIAMMDEVAARYHTSYDKEDVERVVDSVASRGYRASQTNVIEYYCEELLNPKKPRNAGRDKDSVSVDNGNNFATKAFIPGGYGLSKSHIELSKPYTEVFGIPFINIHHSLFKTIALKYSKKYSRAGRVAKGKNTAVDKLWAKRLHEVDVNAEKAERQLIKEIKHGSLMSKFLVGDKTKETQVEGEGLGFMSSLEKGLRKVVSFSSNQTLIKNILKLIKLAMDGVETPVSRSTLVIATDGQHAYDMNPIVSNDVNDQYAHVRVFNPVKPEKTAAVSKKYLKHFYDIVNPLENADEYIACGAFSPSIPNNVGGNGMFRAQMQTIYGGAIDPSAVPDAAITAFRQDIIQHGGYPFTYVLTDQASGDNNQVYKIVRNNNFLGDLLRLDVDLVAIHVKKGGMDGIFIMENREAEVLFS